MSQNSRGSNLRNSRINEDASDSAKALDDYFNESPENASVNTSGWGENDTLVDKSKQIAEKLLSDAHSWDHVPGTMAAHLKTLIEAANAPEFDVTTVIRHFRAEVMSQKHYDTRSKTNRRHGDALPGWKHEMMCTMLFAEDSSGSMSDDDIALGEAFVGLFIKHAKVSFCSWDCDCSEIVKVKTKRDAKCLEIEGRGGTNPQCIIDKLEDERLKFGGIVVFTDNYFNWEEPSRRWANKIFIISTENSGDPPDWVRYHLSMKDIRKYMEA